jgi:peptidoglycan/xylan/chitin deacetylase (PgdA/CDA1 family)
MMPWWIGTGVAAGAVVGGCTWAAVSPRNGFWGPVIWHGPRDGSKRVALTFDDGPTAPYTGEILDQLGALKVPATFFAIGRNIARDGELIGRAHAEGHLIGNHSQDHWHYGVTRREKYWTRQIVDTADAIERRIGRRPAMFRPPMGVKTWHTARAAAATGHATVTWTRRGLDGVSTTTQKIVHRLTANTVGGDILLLHDGIEPKGRTTPAVTVTTIRPVVEGLRARGLELVRLDELLGIPGYQTIA